MLKKTDVLMGGHVMLDEEMSYVFCGKEKDGDRVVMILNGKGITVEGLAVDVITSIMDHYGANKIGKVAFMSALMAKVRTEVLTDPDIKMVLEFGGCKFDPDEFMDWAKEDEKKDH